jgi:CHAD domain-containing protein
MTLVATAAVGLGVALARTGEERRAGARRRHRPGRLGLAHDEALAGGLRRMALEQADVVIGGLADADQGDARRAVHEARKAIKRLRTIVRLLEGQLGRRSSTREHNALGAAAALLAGARDAEVMLNTLEGLLARHPGRLAGKAGVASLRLQLAHDRDQAERRVLEPGNRLRVGDELRLFRGRAAGWQLLERPGTGAVEDGLSRVYRQGRKRFRRAAGKRGGRMRTMHQWRKRVKDLRYSAEALQHEMPAARTSRKGSGRAATARAEAKWLRRLARRADALGEVLGEEHDLAVLGEWIAAAGAGAGAGRASRRRLLKLIARRRRKLRRRALRAGRELYGRKPARFVGRAAKAYRRSSPALSRR